MASRLPLTVGFPIANYSVFHAVSMQSPAAVKILKKEGRVKKFLLLYNPNMTLPIDDIYVFNVLNKLFYI